MAPVSVVFGAVATMADPAGILDTRAPRWELGRPAMRDEVGRIRPQKTSRLTAHAWLAGRRTVFGMSFHPL